MSLNKDLKNAWVQFFKAFISKSGLLIKISF